MMTWSFAAVIAAIKSYAALFGGGVLIALGFFLGNRRSEKKLASAQNEIRRRDFNDQIKPLEQRANAITQEIEKDEAKAKEAEDKMRAILDRTSAGSGPDCGSR